MNETGSWKHQCLGRDLTKLALWHLKKKSEKIDKTLLPADLYTRIWTIQKRVYTFTFMCKTARSPLWSHSDEQTNASWCSMTNEGFLSGVGTYLCTFWLDWHVCMFVLGTQKKTLASEPHFTGALLNHRVSRFQHNTCRAAFEFQNTWTGTLWRDETADVWSNNKYMILKQQRKVFCCRNDLRNLPCFFCSLLRTARINFWAVLLELGVLCKITPDCITALQKLECKWSPFFTTVVHAVQQTFSSFGHSASDNCPLIPVDSPHLETPAKHWLGRASDKNIHFGNLMFLRTWQHISLEKTT